MTLRLVTDPENGNAKVVELLTEMLDRAKRGDVRQAVVVVESSDEIEVSWAGRPLKLAGLLARAQYVISKRADERRQTMTRTDCRKILNSLKAAEGACEDPTRGILDELVAAFPRAPWRAAARRHPVRAVREYFYPPRVKRVKNPLTMEGMRKALEAWVIPDDVPNPFYEMLVRTETKEVRDG